MIFVRIDRRASMRSSPKVPSKPPRAYTRTSILSSISGEFQVNNSYDRAICRSRSYRDSIDRNAGDRGSQ